MGKAKPQTFKRLSPHEAEVVGDAADFDWDGAVSLPARPRPDSVQFSLRVERVLYEEIQAMARDRSATFSDVAREALETFVITGGETSSSIQVSFGHALVTAEGHRLELGWNRAPSLGRPTGFAADTDLLEGPTPSYRLEPKTA